MNPELTDERLRIGWTKDGKRTHVLLTGTWTAHCNSAVDIVTRADLNNLNWHNVNCKRCAAFLATIKPQEGREK